MEYFVERELRAVSKAKEAVEAENAALNTALRSIYATVRPLMPPTADKPPDQDSPTTLQAIRLSSKDPARSASFLCGVLTLPKALIAEDGKSAIVRLSNMRLELHVNDEDESGESAAHLHEHAIKLTATTPSVELVRKALVAKNSLWGLMRPRDQKVLEFLDLDGYHWEMIEDEEEGSPGAVQPPSPEPEPEPEPERELETEIYELRVEDFSDVPKEKKAFGGKGKAVATS